MTACPAATQAMYMAGAMMKVLWCSFDNLLFSSFFSYLFFLISSPGFLCHTLYRFFIIILFSFLLLFLVTIIVTLFLSLNFFSQFDTLGLDLSLIFYFNWFYMRFTRS